MYVFIYILYWGITITTLINVSGVIPLPGNADLSDVVVFCGSLFWRCNSISESGGSREVVVGISESDYQFSSIKKKMTVFRRFEEKNFSYKSLKLTIIFLQ